MHQLFPHHYLSCVEKLLKCEKFANVVTAAATALNTDACLDVVVTG